MSKSGFRNRLASAPLVVVATLAVAAPAFAGEDINPTLKAAMQRDLGMSAKQLVQYQKIERITALQERALAKAQGSHYAGSWIERKADGSYQLVVGSTSIKPQKAMAGVEIRQVRRNLEGLNASKGQLDEVIKRGKRAPRGVYSWYVDPQSNSVVVGVAKDGQEAGIDFVARSGADAGAVRFETMDAAPRLQANLQGGDGIYRDLPEVGPGWISRCSIGFPVSKGSDQGFATAGHCDSASGGAVVYDEASDVKIGSFAASSMPDDNESGPDRAWVKVDTTQTLSPSVYGYGKGDVTVKGSTEASIGAAVCRSGRTTGWRCGTIKAKNVTVSYVDDDGNPDGTVTGLTRSNACSEGGDSGGSFITSAGQGQGVLSGGNTPDGRCTAKTTRYTSYYTPLNSVLGAYSLTLKTSP
ncbi:S1 family peptidase [Luteimonas aquatica]|uniref:S1 family peptidase n=1 Tax=Luteimonas aquatica TaxID=450364 RepID=UPI001F583041|nr:S1 family peptidase [Luteimonas aquatica]